MNKEIVASLPLQKQNLAVSLCQGKWWPAGLRGKVRRWELDHKEVCASKNGCFQIVVLEKTLASPLDSEKVKPVNPKGNQPWIFIERTNSEAKTLMLWPSDAKNWLTGKDPDAGIDWRQKEKGAAEDEMVRWHHRFKRCEFEQTQEDSKGAWQAAVYGVTKS